MLKAALLTFLCATAYAEPIGPFVFRVCKVDTLTDGTVISRRVSNKKAASMCVVLVPCDKADFGLIENDNSVGTHYFSKNAGKCK